MRQIVSLSFLSTALIGVSGIAFAQSAPTYDPQAQYQPSAAQQAQFQQQYRVQTAVQYPQGYYTANGYSAAPSAAVNPYAAPVAAAQPTYAVPRVAAPAAQARYAQPQYVQPAAAQPAVARPVAAMAIQPITAPRVIAPVATQADDAQPQNLSPAAGYSAGGYAATPASQGYGYNNYQNVNGNRMQYGNVPKAARDDHELETSLKGGYRTGRLRWNIAGDTSGQNPNVLSELTWDKLQMATIDGGLRYTSQDPSFKHLRLEGSGYYGYAISGDNQDSDYELDNRTNEFSRSNNSGDGGAAWGAKAAIGYEIPVVETRSGFAVKGTPLVGYQYHGQRMRATEGNQTVCGTAPSFGFDCTGFPLGPFDGLNSHYNATWTGAFLGLETEFSYGDVHRLRLRGEYGYMDYKASARWNLREEFRQDNSFKHDATGSGGTLQAEYRYGLGDGLGLTMSGELTRFEATDGTDTTFFADNTYAETRFNKVTWDSQAYRVGVEQQF